MRSTNREGLGGDSPQIAERRGYHVVYHTSETNYCPGCGRSHWYVGRLSAECCFCATALPLAGGFTQGAGLFRTGHGGAPPDFAAAA